MKSHNFKRIGWLSALTAIFCLGLTSPVSAQQDCNLTFSPYPASLSSYITSYPYYNTSLSVQQQLISTFLVDVTNIVNHTNYPAPVPYGLYPAYCVDGVTPLATAFTIPGTLFSGALYSTCDPNLNGELPPGHPNTLVSPAVWNMVNYILNYHMYNGSNAFYWDVQAAINTLVGSAAGSPDPCGGFYTTPVPSGGCEGYPVFDPVAVNALLTAATNNAPSWVPQCGQVLGAIYVTAPTNQFLIIGVPVPCTPCIGVTKTIACLGPTNSCGAFGKTAQGYVGVGCAGVSEPAFCYQITLTNCGTIPLTNIVVSDSLLGTLTTNFFTNSTQVFAPGTSVTAVFSMSVAGTTTNTVTVTGAADLAHTVTNGSSVYANGAQVTATDSAVALVDTAAVSCNLTLYSPLDLDGNTNDSNVILPTATYYSTPNTVTLNIHVCNAGNSSLNNISINIPTLSQFNCSAPGAFSLAAGACKDFQLCVGMVTCPAQMNFAVTITGQVAPDATHCGVYDLSSTNLVGVCSSCMGSVSCSTNTGCEAGTANVSGTVLLHCNAASSDTSGDSGLAGVTVTLLNAANVPIGTNITDAGGNYTFTGLAAGVYYVQVTTPANYVETYPAGNNTGEVPITIVVCSNVTNVNFGYASTLPPIISVVPGSFLGCNPASLPTPASVASNVTAVVSCGTATTNITYVDSTNGCLLTRTFTIIVTDTYGNSGTNTTLTYTWTADTAPPVLSGVPAGTNYGCNPASVATVASVQAAVSASDTCSPATINVTEADSTNGCLLTQIFTIIATNACGNTATAYVTNIWTADTNAPVLSGVPAGTNYGCNPKSVATVASILSTVTASDTCSPATVSATVACTSNNCAVTQIFTILATNACGNTATAYVTNTWTADTAAPVLSGVPAGTNYGCNPASVATVISILSTVTASDTCSPATVSATEADSTNGCLMTQIFTITATNACGNMATAYVTNTWTADTTPPVISGVPAGTNYGCNPKGVATAASILSTVTASDTCSPATVSATVACTSNNCAVTQIFTILATNACGNTATAYVTNTWTADTAAPVLSGVPAGVNYGCNPKSVATVTSTLSGVTASDTCSPATVSATSVCTTNGCAVTQIFTILATNACGNTATAYVTNTWTADTAAPVLSGVPAGVNYGCNPKSVATVTSTLSGVTASDTCSPATVSATSVCTTNGCAVTQIFTILATNACGNTATAYVTNTWTADTAAPVLSGVPAGVNYGCNPKSVATVTSTLSGVTASDTCSPATVSATSVCTTNGCAVTQIFTILATNACGNTATAHVTNTWTADTAAPVLSGIPAGKNLGCNPASVPTTTSVLSGVTASDSCSPATVSATAACTTNGCAVTQTITILATNACGNTATAYVTNMWTADTAAPVLSGVAAGKNLGCNPASVPTTASVLSGVTASDTCSPATVSATSVCTTNGCAVTQIFTILATNACGNSATANITNTWTVDTTPPVMSGVPAGKNLGCNPTSIPTLASVQAAVSASDTCSAATVKVTGGIATTNGCTMTQVFTIIATNSCGLAATAYVTNTWMADTTPPVLSGIPVGKSLGCNPTNVPTVASVQSAVSASDTCSATTVSVTAANTTNGCTVTQVFTIIATNACGSAATAYVTNSWTADTTPPILSGVPAGKNLGCNPATSSIPTLASVQAAVSASDTCSAATVKVTGGATTTNGCAVTQVFTIIATNSCGLAATACVTNTWSTDTTPPILSGVPAGKNLGCNPTSIPTLASVQAAVSASDTCSAATVKVTGGATTSNGCAVTQVFTIIATNACGSAATAYVTNTWTANTIPPVINGVPTGGYLGCSSTNLPADTNVLKGLSASGQCGTASIVVTHQDTTNACLGTRVFTITATDGCGNVTTTNLVYTWTVRTPDYCTNSICCAFNSQNPGSGWLWCNAHVSGKPGQKCTLYCQNATLTLNCKSGKKYTYSVPNGQINFSTTCTVATNWFDGTQWNTTLPCAGDDEIFLQGCGIPWNSDFAGCQSVCWTGVFSCDTAGLAFNWQFGAACFANSQPAYTNICPKACHNISCQNGQYYSSGDQAGCPENHKPYCVGGGTGGGGSNCTGSWSGTDTTCTFAPGTTFPPVLNGVPPGECLGLNPTNIPTVAIILSEVSASDTCSPATVTATMTDTTNSCVVTQIFTITALNGCGDKAMAYVTNTWTTMSLTNKCTNSICCSFNSSNPGSGWLWCNSHISGKPGNKAVTVFCQNATITLTCKSGKVYTYPVPNGQINFSPTCTVATNWFDGTQWNTTVPCAGDDEIFLHGCAIPWNSDFASCQSACWSGSFSCNTPGFNCNWQWGAACYNNSQPSCASICPKACHQTACPNGQYYNSNDQAGCPENHSPYCVGAGTSTGSSNCTGNWSNTGTCSF